MLPQLKSVLLQHVSPAITCLHSIYLLPQHLHASTLKHLLYLREAACRSSWLFWDCIYWLIEWLLAPHTYSSKENFWCMLQLGHFSTIRSKQYWDTFSTWLTSQVSSMVLSTYTLQVPQSKLQPWILLDSKHGFAWIYQVSGARELIVWFLLVEFFKIDCGVWFQCLSLFNGFHYQKRFKGPSSVCSILKKAEAIGLHSINLMLEPSLPYRSGYSPTMAANTGFK